MPSRAEGRTFLLTILALVTGCAAPPAVDADAYYNIHATQTTAKQGSVVILHIDPVGQFNGAEPPPVAKFNNETYKAFPVSRDAASDKDAAGATTSEAGPVSYRAFVSVPVLLKPGAYKISVGQTAVPLNVVWGGFGLQHLRLPPGKDNFVSSPGEEETVDKARHTVSPEKFWAGKFQTPSAARVSSTFGVRRMVNGKLLDDYFHSGIDYAGGYGSPVKATQAGRILIAHTGWRLHGGTVAIDHGQGVVSFYIHMSKLLVKEGQMVAAGQEIGKIGATGRASGPHLHFSLYVSGNATNPNYWYQNAVQ